MLTCISPNAKFNWACERWNLRFCRGGVGRQARVERPQLGLYGVDLDEVEALDGQIMAGFQDPGGG